MFLSFLLGTKLLFVWFLAYLQVFLNKYRSEKGETADPPPFTIREFSVLNRLKNNPRILKASAFQATLTALC